MVQWVRRRGAHTLMGRVSLVIFFFKKVMRRKSGNLRNVHACLVLLKAYGMRVHHQVKNQISRPCHFLPSMRPLKVADWD